MPGGPIIFDTLTQWTEQHLTGLYNATTEQAFDAEFDLTFGEHCKFTVNDKEISRTQYKKQIRSEQSLEVSADIKFDKAVEVPTEKGEFVEAGIVGLFFEVTIYKKLKVHGADESSTVTLSFNAVIGADKSLHSRGPGPVDLRRILTLNQVFVDKANPVKL